MVNAYGSNTVLGAQRGRTAFSGPIRVNTFRGHNDRFGSNVGRSSHHLSPITNPGFQTAAVNGGAYQTPVSNNAVYRPAANNAVYQGNQNTNVYRGQTQFQDPRLGELSRYNIFYFTTDTQLYDRTRWLRFDVIRITNYHS